MEKTEIVMDHEKKDFRKLYEDLVKSDWFKKAYHDKSLGDCPFDIPELAESEDERIRNNIIVSVKMNGGLTQARKSEIYAYLEKQKEQKPAEWSEEDERMLKSTIWHISNSLTNGKNTDCKCDLTEWLKEKLKSLRPSWKPSEEQEEPEYYQHPV